PRPHPAALRSSRLRCSAATDPQRREALLLARGNRLGIVPLAICETGAWRRPRAETCVRASTRVRIDAHTAWLCPEAEAHLENLRPARLPLVGASGHAWNANGRPFGDASSRPRRARAGDR